MKKRCKEMYCIILHPFYYQIFYFFNIYQSIRGDSQQLFKNKTKFTISQVVEYNNNENVFLLDTTLDPIRKGKITKVMDFTDKSGKQIFVYFSKRK